MKLIINGIEMRTMPERLEIELRAEPGDEFGDLPDGLSVRFTGGNWSVGRLCKDCPAIEIQWHDEGMRSMVGEHSVADSRAYFAGEAVAFEADPLTVANRLTL